MVLLVAVIKIAPVFITKMTLNNYANELCREAEIAGRICTETTAHLDRLNESHPDLNPTVTWSASKKCADWKNMHRDRFRTV